MEKETKLIGQVDQAQIDAWKAKPDVKGVHAIEVGGHICYLKTPDRNVISYATMHMSFKMSPGESAGLDGVEMSMGRLYKTGEAVLTNCWLGGSEEIKSNDTFWFNACVKAGELIDFKETTLKNL